MKKAIKISIPEPCHEDWAKMTPSEKGKFCSVCTKEVFDFTETSDEELVKRVTQGKNLCGRFKKSQLDREVKLERKSSNSLLPYAASLLMPLSMMASEVKNNSVIEKPFVSLGIGSRTVNDIKSIIEVTGYVRDEHFNPIKNASLIIVETGKMVKTNAEGYYLLKCASSSSIQVVKEKMMTQTVKLGTRNQRVNFSMYPEVEMQVSILGRIAPSEVVEEDITIGDVEEIIEDIQEKQDSTKVTIKGTVTDEMNMPLPGLNVMIKRTSIGTQTNFDGHFEIQTEPNQTLVFSYLGFFNKEILISNISNTINIQMKTDDRVLGGAVVFCYVEKSNQDYIPNPYQSDSYYDQDQRENREKRRAYAEKENAFKKVKADRKKAARLQKRSRKKDK